MRVLKPKGFAIIVLLLTLVAFAFSGTVFAPDSHAAPKKKTKKAAAQKKQEKPAADKNEPAKKELYLVMDWSRSFYIQRDYIFGQIEESLKDPKQPYETIAVVALSGYAKILVPPTYIKDFKKPKEFSVDKPIASIHGIKLAWQMIDELGKDERKKDVVLVGDVMPILEEDTKDFENILFQTVNQNLKMYQEKHASFFVIYGSQTGKSAEEAYQKMAKQTGGLAVPFEGSFRIKFKPFFTAMKESTKAATLAAEDDKPKKLEKWYPEWVAVVMLSLQLAFIIFGMIVLFRTLRRVEVVRWKMMRKQAGEEEPDGTRPKTKVGAAPAARGAADPFVRDRGQTGPGEPTRTDSPFISDTPKTMPPKPKRKRGGAPTPPAQAPGADNPSWEDDFSAEAAAAEDFISEDETPVDPNAVDAQIGDDSGLDDIFADQDEVQDELANPSELEIEEYEDEEEPGQRTVAWIPCDTIRDSLKDAGVNLKDSFEDEYPFGLNSEDLGHMMRTMLKGKQIKASIALAELWLATFSDSDPEHVPQVSTFLDKIRPLAS